MYKVNKPSFTSSRVKRWSENATPHVIHKSCGNGNRIACPSIKAERESELLKCSFSLSFCK